MFALVDDEDFERVSQFKWFASYNSKNKSYYASRMLHPSRKTVEMSRFIMDTPEGLTCDHINHDTLDNRKSNLRNCTWSQNGMNKGPRKDNKLGLKCISIHQNMYRVEISANGKRVFRKTFHELEDAIKARDEKLKEFHGEFAKTE
jgi:hypothetical protein